MAGKVTLEECVRKYKDIRRCVSVRENISSYRLNLDEQTMRTLSECLIRDLNIQFEVPPYRVPVIIMQLSYIQWLKETLGQDGNKCGIDIETGSECLLPLIASRTDGWHFIATESNARNLMHARANVTKNGLQHLILVRAANVESVLVGLVQNFDASIPLDFCTCIPPYFAEETLASSVSQTRRSRRRRRRRGQDIPDSTHYFLQGREFEYIRHLINESAILKNRIKIYSAVVSSTSNLTRLKEDLLLHKVADFSTTILYQGGTVRWGLAWTFDSTLRFRYSESKQHQQRCSIPVWYGTIESQMHQIADFLRSELKSIQVHCIQVVRADATSKTLITAAKNTWVKHHVHFSSQLEKAVIEAYREGMHESKFQSEEECIETDPDPVETAEISDKLKFTVSLDGEDSNSGFRGIKRPAEQPVVVEDNKRARESEKQTEATTSRDDSFMKAWETFLKTSSSQGCTLGEAGIDTPGTSSQCSLPGPTACYCQAGPSTAPEGLPPAQYILKCQMTLTVEDGKVQLVLEWIDGKHRYLMTQLMMFLRNKLAQPRRFN